MRRPDPSGRFPPRGRGSLRLLVLGGLLCLAGPMAPAAAQIPALTPGLRLEERLAAGESRRYPVDLRAGEMLRAVVIEEGIDVVVRLLAPDGAEVAHVDGPRRPKEDEELTAIAPRDGIYRLEVSREDRAAPSGCYVLRIEAIRPADDRDRLRAQAVALTQEAVEQMLRDDETGRRRQLATRERSLALWRSLGDGERVAMALFRIGELRLGLEEVEPASRSLHQAVDGFRAAGDRGGLAAALNEAGRADRKLWRAAEAVGHFAEGLGLARAVADRRLEANLLDNLGNAYDDLGRPHEALEPIASARQIAHDLGDAKIEARTLTNLGVAYADLGERQMALGRYHEALEIARRAGLRYAAAAAWNNLGDTHDALGQWDKAESEHRRALALFQELGRRKEEARSWSNLAVVLRHLGHYRKAADAFAHAVAISRADGEREIEATAAADLALLELVRGKRAQALAAAEAAQRVAPAGGEGEANAWHALGAVRRGVGDLAGAAAALERALAASRARGNRTREADVLLFLAETARDGGDLERAAELARASLEIVESLRTRVASADLRASFFASRQPFYEFAIDTLMELERARPSQGFAAQALAVAERARARSLLEVLATAGAEPRQHIAAQLADREQRARRDVSAAELHLQALLRRDAAPLADAEIAEATRRVDAAVATYGQVENELADESPSYASLVQPQPLSTAEIERQVLDPDTVLLEFALGERRSYLWALADGVLTSYELPARTGVETAAHLFYDLVTARNAAVAGEAPPARKARLDRAARQLPAAGAALSRMLLAPAAARLRHRRLAIVADGLLQYIPFAALLEPGLRRAGAPALVAAHEVVNLPSASALAVLRRELAGRPPAPRQLAVLADPVFGRDDSRLREGLSQARPRRAGRAGRAARGAVAPAPRGCTESEDGLGAASFPRLHFSSEEAESIAALVRPDERLVAMGFDASREAALSGELANYRIVHFATHGCIDSVHPALSSLVLSLVDRHGRAEDGFLRLADIYNLDLHADLVVLSACRTALGKEVRGEGLIGLTRGFMHAGATRVLSSLWNVDDRATAELMKRFYRRMLGEHLRPEAALRAAQLSMAREPRWASPYYWAGFSLEGEWR